MENNFLSSQGSSGRSVFSWFCGTSSWICPYRRSCCRKTVMDTPALCLGMDLFYRNTDFRDTHILLLQLLAFQLEMPASWTPVSSVHRKNNTGKNCPLPYPSLWHSHPEKAPEDFSRMCFLNIILHKLHPECIGSCSIGEGHGIPRNWSCSYNSSPWKEVFFCPEYKGRFRVHLSLLSPLPEYHAAPDGTKQSLTEDSTEGIFFPFIRSIAIQSFFFYFFLPVPGKDSTLVSFFPVTAGNASALHYPVFLHYPLLVFHIYSSFFLSSIYYPLSGTVLFFFHFLSVYCFS